MTEKPEHDVSIIMHFVVRSDTLAEAKQLASKYIESRLSNAPMTTDDSLTYVSDILEEEKTRKQRNKEQIYQYYERVVATCSCITCGAKQGEKCARLKTSSFQAPKFVLTPHHGRRTTYARKIKQDQYKKLLTVKERTELNDSAGD